MSEHNKGVLNAIVAYACWGVFPLYWKLLEQVSSMEILLSRVIWSFVFTTLFILLIGQRKNLLQDIRFLWANQKQFWTLFAASVVISINWFTYIWAVTNGQVLQSSLGYYINPLISVLFGMLFFREKLSNATIVAVSIAGVGVTVTTFSGGTVPWIALTMAISFSIYGVLKKTIQLEATRGLAIETLFMLPIALIYYAYIWTSNDMRFLQGDVKTDLLLMGGGIVTAIPLVLFAKGAHRIPLYLMGFIQFLSPTITLCIGILLFKEPFTKLEFFTFGCIWIAIVIFSASKFIEAKRRHQIIEYPKSKLS
ncbi:protein RarD [Solibacillus sp. R5-41]|uniref:EamA family transporter RarD n=1 Tax=Solibacillus sp. R5-41 TaxID=2048654 RepID=UPI000C1249A7|nr:EamA family transporter RarD [Solibacillus sp. R5-41]ATP40568.1 protein RarD [Solibacillus sp. R5-41]